MPYVNIRTNREGASAGQKARPEPGAWAIALAGVACLAVVMGIGRFAFTPLLPMMLHDGTVNLHEGGWLATLNYIGYFVGAAICLFIRPDPARMIRLGLVATVLLTLGMALPGGMLAWSLWRAAAGVASALVLVYTSGWCMQRLAELGQPALGGLIFCGPGIGIVVTGVSAFAMVGAGWHAVAGWVAFTVMGALLVLAVWRVFASGDTPFPADAPRQEAHPARGARLDGEPGRSRWPMAWRASATSSRRPSCP